MAYTTKVLNDASATRAAVLELFDWARDICFAYAWMSADETRGSPWARFPFAKVAAGVVGLQFAGTDVDVLDAFMDRVPEKIRVMYETKGTFHPKILVGIRGTEARAIIGSANFTRAAFSANYEVGVLLEGEPSEPPISELLAIIENYFSSPKTRRLDPRLIEAYRAAWKRKPKPPRLPLLRRGSKGDYKVEKAGDLDIGWENYYELVISQDDRDFLNVEGAIRVIPTATDDNAYLTELRRCQSAFAEYGALAAMPPTVRQIVAGFGDSQGWFGSMIGAGYYKQIINSHPDELSAALDQIPRGGPVADDVFLQASERALGLHGVGLGCWSRLISMKRPDMFLSLNNANLERVREVFGKAAGTPKTYLKFTRRILDLPWASAPPPVDDSEREIWEGRVALLDAILYEPVGDGR